MIGDKLRQAREAKKLSIKDAEQGTSIRALYIDAIEKGDYKALPGEAYLKGFIKSYANFLGFDGHEAVEEYKAEQAEKAAAEEAARLAQEGEAKPQEKAKPVEKKFKYTAPVGKKHHVQLWGRLVVSLGLLVCLLGAYTFFASADDGSEEAAVETETVAAKPVDTKPAVDIAAKKKTETKKKEEAKPASDVAIELKLSDRCWLQVEVDKRVVYEGTAQGGTKLSWTGKENVKITAGNAGAVEISENGKSLGLLGESGEVVTKDYTKAASAPDNGKAKKK
jgi:cytoskeletal protein RodZ